MKEIQRVDMNDVELCHLRFQSMTQRGRSLPLPRRLDREKADIYIGKTKEVSRFPMISVDRVISGKNRNLVAAIGNALRHFQARLRWAAALRVERGQDMQYAQPNLRLVVARRAARTICSMPTIPI